MPIANEHEALTREAQEAMDEVRDWFGGWVKTKPQFKVRDLEYLAVCEIHQRAAEIVLTRAVRRRKR